MDLLSRYRNLTVLLLVIFAQLILLAYQVKSKDKDKDVPLVRVWAVTAVTPLANLIETIRSHTVDLADNYIFLRDVREQNQRIKDEIARLKIDNQYLRSELETADRVKTLSAFQATTPSRTLLARVIGTAPGSNSRVVFVDRGTHGGVMRGMAVITPEGIVGKVVAAYPTASQVLLLTDPTFSAGVISQKHRVHGDVRGLGQSKCQIDYIQNEETVETGEKFYTSGDDGVFPKGLLAGTAIAVQSGPSSKQVFLDPAALHGGLEEVLIIVEGVHQPIPDISTASPEIHLQPPAAAAQETPRPDGQAEVAGTEADRLREKYEQIGAAQNHVFGTGLPGSKPPDFNADPGKAPRKTAPPPPVAGGSPDIPPDKAAARP
ncbi:MAG: rod shape-determining protein MreC [Bryobacteraceae bacterium]